MATPAPRPRSVEPIGGDPLTERVQALEEQLEILLEESAGSGSCVLPICTFAPEPYRLKRPIPIVVRPEGEEFIASFVDASIHSSGETHQEAFENVKSLILDMFDSLRSHRPDKLGPAMARRLAVLQEFIDAA